MVYRDISSEVDLNKIGSGRSSAHVLDRFFSFVIDYLVLSPFVMFTMYLVFNDGFRYVKANPMAAENDLFFGLVSVCFVILFALVQTVFIGLLHATPGQYFLKIKFEFAEINSLTFIRVFSRQTAFWLSFLFLGIPFLSIMTNKRRRTFYDEIGDTTIISSKNEKYSFDFENEFNYWRALTGTLSLFFFFLVGSVIWSHYEKIVHRRPSFAQLESKKFFCEDLKDVNEDDRLGVAVALNLVNQVSDECLDKEADFVLWRQKFAQISLAYYAKSLTTEDERKENKYLIQACEGQDVSGTEMDLGCKIARAFKYNRLDELYADLNEPGLLSSVIKYELSQSLSKSRDRNLHFASLDEYSYLRQVKKFQLLEVLRNEKLALLSESNRQPASTIDSLPAEGLPADDVLSMKQTEAVNYTEIDKEKIIKLLEEL